MAETQLASMRIGSVDMFDDETGGGGSGVVVPIINIADGQSDEILDDITSDFIIDDTHRRSLEDTLETYAFYTFADKPFTQHLKDRNRIIIPDEDGTLREFIIYESEKYRDTEGYKMYAVSTASYLDLKKANVIYPTKRNNQTASMMVGFATNNTEWRAGIIESDRQLSFEIEEHTDPFSLLKRIAKDFELELRFRVEHNGNRITGRFVDLLERIGEWRGREIEFGKDLDGIRRIENTERIVTALVGLGPEREDGTRLEVLVEDEEALQRWGRPDPVTGELRHLIEVYEPQSERQEMTLAELRQYTRTELNKRINAVVTYECSVVDLENVPGMEGQKIRYGDTIRIKDEKFNPPLYLEARVYEQDRSIKSQAKKDIKLGDYIEYTEEEVYAIWRQLEREVKKRITAAELREYAEPKKIESETPPPIKEGENPIWVKIDGDIKVPHVVVGDEWVKMTPTTAEEVDAYTKQQTDDIAEDASRLKTGIIDVNQVPLRTSITGARIEWDGINGLVQYDADGNPVSWLDLDGNAHFENGYFSGRIEALEGFFGDSVMISDSKVRIIRPDGAIAISDGLIAGGEPLNGYDPHYMRMGRSDAGTVSNTFKAFSSEMDSWYNSFKGRLDGRGLPGWDLSYEDVRDGMGTVVFQRYTFTHKSRYMVFRFHKRAGATFSVHVVKGASDNISDRVYYEKLESDMSGVFTFVTDLGKPTYTEKDFSFKIGWTNSWGSREEVISFRMISAYQTDFI